MPETTAAMLPQTEHEAERRRQSGHYVRPVVREVPQGFSSPQMLQVAVGREGQMEQRHATAAARQGSPCHGGLGDYAQYCCSLPIDRYMQSAFSISCSTASRLRLVSRSITSSGG